MSNVLNTFCFGVLMRQARTGYPAEGVRDLAERLNAKGYIGDAEFDEVMGCLEGHPVADARGAEDSPAQFVDALAEVLAGDRGRAEILGLIADSVEVEPAPIRKEGYRPVKHYSHEMNAIWWSLEPDPEWKPEPDGTYTRPFVWEGECEIHTGEWWTDGEDIWEAVSDGIAQAFNVPWFDVVYSEDVGD